MMSRRLKSIREILSFLLVLLMLFSVVPNVDSYAASYNLSDCSLSTTDIRNASKTVNYKTSNGKYAVFVFGSIGTDTNTEDAIKYLSELSSSTDMNKVDFFAFDIKSNSHQTIVNKLNTIDSKGVVKCAARNADINALYNKCLKAAGINGTWILPLIVYVGKDGTVLKTTTAGSGKREIAANMINAGLPCTFDLSLATLSVNGYSDYTAAYKILDLVNVERGKAGLQPLKMDEDLLNAAMQRSAECVVYYSHTRPTLEPCFSISKKMYAENIAYGYASAESVMNGWMNSAGHRANILTAKYTTIGIGCVKGANGTWYWAQAFGINTASTPKTHSDATVTYTVKCDKSLVSTAENVAGVTVIDDGTSGGSDVGGGSTGDGSSSGGSSDGSTPQGSGRVAAYYNINQNGGEWTNERYYLNGEMMHDCFFCDGTYTYYLEWNGAPMKDKLTYHPDGVHVIYFDEYGHEVFSNFAHVRKSIAGTAVDDYCFFDVYGYMYVDVMTYDITGKKLYYINPYGQIERNGWFKFSSTAIWAGTTKKVGTGWGYGQADGTLMINTWTFNKLGKKVYMQGDGHMK